MLGTEEVEYTFKPIERWPGKLELPFNRRHSPFRTAWSNTLDLLDREIANLRGKQVVIQMALTDADIRLDGRPRAQARPEHPGVIVSFNSKWGPIQYATDAFHDWQDNVRAIALSLEALRKVDRYGVSKRGEQYTGWKALPPGSATEQEQALEDMTREEAEEIIGEFGGGRVNDALKATHPDHGGDPEDFAKVQRARVVLGE
jgi:hypothetical protein